MSQTDLAIRDQIQALNLKLFRISVTADTSLKLPIKIPLKPMKTVAHALAKVKYLRFSRSKGYHIGLIPLEPRHFLVLQSSDAAFLNALQQHLPVLYWNAYQAQAWIHADHWHTELANTLIAAGFSYDVLNPETGVAALTGFAS
ncbi:MULTISPECIES: hypothetical protein [Vitreoscilla]|uniref:Uncharacterized protein n=1 Tax=Vitreoscilla stercoraria TaxID=61 RepID=A0ABY4EAB4_VITST|nr:MULTISPECIES: hypothetical protein [Vitreoscilla]UOO91875.1 hypothetical protein LVJ81_09550 [Vitreoscilla stercoraria]